MQQPGVVVAVRAGSLAGRVTPAGGTSWRGVPYAAPPVGPRRFRAPEPVAPWPGTRDATRFAGAAHQGGAFGGSRRRLGSAVGEDCLYLNVDAPPGAPGDERPRPVLVWLHGGAWTGGSGALYDGGPLAAQGDVVVVTVNYRLGVFGFVDLGGVLGVDVPSNLGLRDQLAALEWVRDNIGAFGGDPGRVTVAGESAGSASVTLLLTAPRARGLFDAAVLESGTYTLVHSAVTREEVARHYARALGLGPRDAARLWELPASALVGAQAAVSRRFSGTTPAAPWFDADLVPGSLAEAQAAVRPDVALLAGANHDEVTLFSRLPGGDVLPTSRAALAARLRAEWGWDEAAPLLAGYPRTAAGTRALGTDLNFAMPTLHFAERHAAAGGPTFFYRFDAAVPLLGATHAAELPYLWDWHGGMARLLRGRRTVERRALAARMRRAWLAFVRDRDPGGGWPGFTLPERRTLVLDPASDRVEDDPGRSRRVLWAGRDVLPRG